ncbi:hypothetical protein ACFY1V_31770 [Streptomyces sp. NPDC001255]|uniref:hypothetical protein n=1 Tax=Streptomyces sp. NPDC001255 TaxID=3364550 RepID=UPI0036CF1DD4
MEDEFWTLDQVTDYLRTVPLNGRFTLNARLGRQGAARHLGEWRIEEGEAGYRADEVRDAALALRGLRLVETPRWRALQWARERRLMPVEAFCGDARKPWRLRCRECGSVRALVPQGNHRRCPTCMEIDVFEKDFQREWKARERQEAAQQRAAERVVQQEQAAQRREREGRERAAREERERAEWEANAPVRQARAVGAEDAAPLVPLRSGALARQLGARSDAPHDASAFYPLINPAARPVPFETPDAYTPHPASAPSTDRHAFLVHRDGLWALQVLDFPDPSPAAETVSLLAEDFGPAAGPPPTGEAEDLLRRTGWQTTTWEPLAGPTAPGLRMRITSALTPVHEVAYRHLGSRTQVWQDAARTAVRNGVRPLGAFRHLETGEPVPVCVLGEALSAPHAAKVRAHRARTTRQVRESQLLAEAREFYYKSFLYDDAREQGDEEMIEQYKNWYLNRPEGLFAHENREVTQLAYQQAQRRREAERRQEAERRREAERLRETPPEGGKPRPYDGLTPAQIFAALFNNNPQAPWPGPLSIEEAERELASRASGEGGEKRDWVKVQFHSRTPLGLLFTRDHWSTEYDFIYGAARLEQVLAHLRSTGDVGRQPGN